MNNESRGYAEQFNAHEHQDPPTAHKINIISEHSYFEPLCYPGKNIRWWFFLNWKYFYNEFLLYCGMQLILVVVDVDLHMHTKTGLRLI